MRARIALVVGVEQMTATPAAEIGQDLLQGVLPPGGGRYRRSGFAGMYRRIAGITSRDTAISPMLMAMIAAKNYK